MKNTIVLFSVVVTVVLCIQLICFRPSIDTNGKVLLNLTRNGNNGITIYDCSKKEFSNVSLEGLQAVFFKNDSVLLNQYDIICEYNLNTEISEIVYQGESFDYFAIRNNKQLSLSKDNYILLYDLKTKEKSVLTQDNGSKIHSWSKNGMLYYSDSDGKVKSVDLDSGEIKEVGIGYDPIISEYNVAYKNKDTLIVKNIQTNDEYTYNGCAYSYCFSPTGKELLVEDEMTIGTGIKNFFNQDIVIGHRLVIWDYANNKQNTIMDSCIATPNLICDWQQ